MDFIRRVKGIKANGLPPTSPESEITPRNDSEIGIEFLQGTPPLLQNQPGNIPSDLNGSVVSQASVATNETDKADKLGVVKKSLAFGSSQVECMMFKSCCLLHVLTCFGCRSNREIVGVGSKTWSKIVCGMWHIVSRPLVCERFPLQSVMALQKFMQALTCFFCEFCGDVQYKQTRFCLLHSTRASHTREVFAYSAHDVSQNCHAMHHSKYGIEVRETAKVVGIK